MKLTKKQLKAKVQAWLAAGLDEAEIVDICKALTVVDADGNPIEDLDVTVMIAPAATDPETKEEGDDEEDEDESEDEMKAIATRMVKTLGSTFDAKLKEIEAQAKRVTGGDLRNDDERQFGFKSFGEQLRAIRAASESHGRTVDKRLLTKAPLGLNETTDSEGGFLIAPQYADGVMEILHAEENLLSRIDSYPINSASTKIRAIDETTRAAGAVRGGVVAYWKAEAESGTASKPKFRLIDMAPHKLFALTYASEEQLEDTGPMLEMMLTRHAAEAIDLKIGQAIVNGTGAGQMLGILNSPCLITQDKEVGQAANTIVLENVVNMWSRLHTSARANAVWLINQDIEPQLLTMSLGVGTGGQVVYMPPGGISATPYATLLGKPVIATEFNSALGTAGDIIVGDLKHYLAVTRGATKAASSIHVQFTTDEQAFRWTFRIDGQPWWSAALTPLNGSSRSPFVTLQTRS